MSKQVMTRMELLCMLDEKIIEFHILTTDTTSENNEH
jgi:hypothetical protein